MLLIPLLMLAACAGLIYSGALLLRDRKRRIAGLIELLEAEKHEIRPAEQEPAMGLLGGLRRLMSAAQLDSYAERLLWAGRPLGLDATQFAGVKVVGAVLLPAVALLLLSGAVAALLAMLGGVIGFFLPDVLLNSMLGERRRQVAQELPLFTDLVATAIEAGLSLSEAVRRVAADSPGLVAREFLRVTREMEAGKSRVQAWRDLTARLPGEDVRTIVQAVMQAEHYGTSVAEILRYQVQQIRLFKQTEAQRIAQVTTVKMRIPMLLLILVPFMVLLLGPAILQVVQLLGK